MTELSIETQTGRLAGTLISAGPIACLIISGSGPTDRDGNSAHGLRTNAYRMLAEGLAGRGISTLRYDKRGVGESRAALISEGALSFDSYVEDAAAWTHELCRRTQSTSVWVIGHSEGALIAENVAIDNPEVCGLVLISGAGRPAAEVLRAQVRSAMPEPLKKAALETISALEAGRRVESPPAELAQLFRPSIQPYMISWLPIDPAAILTQLIQPVLILHGDADSQVPIDDAMLLAAARPDAHLVVLKGVNHILKEVSENPVANLATYNNPDLPLAAIVVDAISQFVGDNGGDA